MCSYKVIPLLAFCCFLATYTTPLSAQWIPNGIPVCIEQETQKNHQIVEDGEGGTYICWEDRRSLTEADIFMQRIDSNGSILWQVNGIPICIAPDDQSIPRMISDGAGGAIVTWQDKRDINNIYAQRIGPDGTVLWANDGVPVSIGPYGQEFPSIVSDGARGAIIVWHDCLATGNSQGYRDKVWRVVAQRLDPDGNRLWNDDGVYLMECYFGSDIAIATDGAGGAIVAASNLKYYDIYDPDLDVIAQRVSPSGETLWKKHGIAICSAPGNNFEVHSVPDGSGGVIISWLDKRDEKLDVYAQRVDTDGNTLWIENGIPVCTTVENKHWPRISSDEVSGAFIVWQEKEDIICQHVSADGLLLWAAGGIAVCDLLLSAQESPEITADGDGGAIVVWMDFRNVERSDIFIQRMDSLGNFLWDTNGIPVCTAGGTQIYPRLISDGTGGALVGWCDTRNVGVDNIYDIYAMRIISPISESHSIDPSACSTQILDSPICASIALRQNHPNPFNPSTIIEYYVPSSCRVTVEIFDVSGARVACLVNEVQDEGAYSVPWDGVNDYGKPVSSGIYFYRLSTEREVISKKMILMR